MGKLDVTSKVITIVAGIVAIITFPAGYLQSFNPSDSIQRLDPWVWYITAGIASAVAILFAIIYRKYRLNHLGVFDAIRDRDNYQWNLGEQSYKDVVWDIYGVNPEPLKTRLSWLRHHPSVPNVGQNLKDRNFVNI